MPAFASGIFMSLQVYLAYVAACVALAILPGPIVTLVIANGLRYGTRAALTNIAGAQVGLVIIKFLFSRHPCFAFFYMAT